jgi:hydrogenase/urease accessory protein HupE
MPPNKKELLIPQDAKAFEVQKQYAMLGIEHIWVGIDHLLFVLCLLIITGFNRKLFWTITGFTIAHSITLVLSALKIIQLPIPPIEATIALSIVFLCYEIIHHHANKDSLTYRYPILVSSSFGLLHGLGFAAVLGEIGLPQTHRATALLFFNIGVEIGQILFIICLWILFYGLKKLFEVLFKQQKQQRVLQLGFRMVIYVVGILASYWMFDRIF